MPKRFRKAPESPIIAVLLTALVAYGPVSTDLYLPSLPAMSAAFGVDAAMGQLTLSVFASGFAVGMLIYGPLSDRFGRRVVLLWGLALYLAATALCLFAPTIEALLAGRLLQALGACSGPVLGRAMVRDIYGRDQAAKMLAYMASAMAIAPAAAPIVGGWLHAAFGWQANFAALLVFGVVVLAATALLLSETNRHINPDALRLDRMAGTYLCMLRDRRFLGYTFSVAFSFAALFSFISGSSFTLIEVIGLKEENFGFAFMVVVGGFLIGSLGSGRLTGKFGGDRLVAVGVTVALIGGIVGAALAWSGIETLWALLLPSAVVFASCGLVMPNATAGGLAPFPTAAGSGVGPDGLRADGHRRPGRRRGRRDARRHHDGGPDDAAGHGRGGFPQLFRPGPPGDSRPPHRRVTEPPHPPDNRSAAVRPALTHSRRQEIIYSK